MTQPKLSVLKSPIQMFTITLRHDDCPKAHDDVVSLYEFTGKQTKGERPQFQHKCSACGNLIIAGDRFPRMDHETMVEAQPEIIPVNVKPMDELAQVRNRIRLPDGTFLDK